MPTESLVLAVLEDVSGISYRDKGLLMSNSITFLLYLMHISRLFICAMATRLILHSCSEDFQGPTPCPSCPRRRASGPDLVAEGHHVTNGVA